MRSKKASVLMISLWILSILVILAISLGHRAAISLKLARNQRDGLKAYLYAKSGIYKAIVLLKEDEKVGSPAENYDTIEACGVNLEDKKPQDFFIHEFENGAGNFKVAYRDSAGEMLYGMGDEDSKINININTVAPANDLEKRIIIGLFTEKGINDADAKELVDTIVMWIDSNTTISKAKKENFNSLEELLLVLEYYYREIKNKLPEDARKEAQATYAKIKDSLRVVGDKKININTASDKTVGILVSAAADGNTIEGSGLVTALNERRKSISSEPVKKDSDLNNFLTGLSSEQTTIYNILKLEIFKVKSDYFRIESTGISGRIEKKITAIYDRLTPSFVYWKEE